MITGKHRAHLIQFCESWENAARIRFRDAAQEKDEFGRRFLENGAVIEANAAYEIRDVLKTKSLLDFLLEPFRKNAKRPRTSGF